MIMRRAFPYWLRRSVTPVSWWQATVAMSAFVTLVWVGCLSTVMVGIARAEPLPEIGPAPDFSLIDQDGNRFASRKLRGRVAVVTFIYTSCSDACPIVTAKMTRVHQALGADAEKVVFVAITIDPLHDSPAILKRYAELYSAPADHFAFLTGDYDEIHDVVRNYGAYFNPRAERDVDHTFLTSIVDRAGILRVQYMGWRFDPKEFLADVESLIGEGG